VAASYFPFAALTLAATLHSALCAGQCATWHSLLQYQTSKHFLSPAPLQSALAQYILASRKAVCSAEAPKSRDTLAAVHVQVRAILDQPDDDMLMFAM
jgi:hypothetical protein